MCTISSCLCGSLGLLGTATAFPVVPLTQGRVERPEATHASMVARRGRCTSWAEMKRPFFMLPVLGIAAALAFGFFKIYGLFTRPDVPLQVSATIDHFAPGVAIGKTMQESRKKVYDARWVQHLGYVGEINSP